jgi:hypothetical protein
MTSPDSLPTSSRPGPDEILGGYRLLSVLGEGGMGVVYKAKDLALDRTVALKCIRPGLARDKSFLRRFRTEARALARIQSPAIVGIHTLRDTEDGLLIDMEFVDGPTLKDRILEAGALPWTTALPLMKDILRAFDAAHAAGVIHRDVKPQNVMLPREGGVKVTDFGLARLHTDGDETVTRGVAGTLKYMSPEQVQGGADLDARSDLFSLGLTFFEMLTGRLPFEEGAGDFELMRMIVETDLPGPRSVQPDVPQELDTIVHRLLRRTPDQRFGSAAETLRALERFEMSQAKEVAAPEPVPSAPDEASAGRRGPWLLGLAVLVLLGVGGTVLFWPSTDATVTIATEPAGASVYVDDRFAGTTPLRDVAVAEGPRAVRVERAGFVPLDTSLVVGAGATTLGGSLRPAPAAAARLTVASEPSGAQVYVDGALVGTTPLDTARIAPDARRLRLERSGYDAYEADLRAQAGAVTDLGTVTLEAQETRPRPAPQRESASSTTPPAPRAAPAKATLRLSTPDGTVSVDGTPVPASGRLTVAPGSRRIVFRHPTYGTADTTLTVAPGAETALTYYFTQPVTVNTLGPWGNVWIDGENRGNTPLRTRLGPGTYRVALRIDRTDAFRITGGTYTRDRGDGGSTSFTGDEVTLTVRPGVDETPHTVSFSVEP